MLGKDIKSSYYFSSPMRGPPIHQCPIWRTNLNLAPKDLGADHFFFSPRAGGYYRLTGEWASLSQRGVSPGKLAQGIPREKASLSYWIYQRNLQASLLVDQPLETGTFRLAPTVNSESVLQSYNRQSPTAEERLLGFVREFLRQQEMNMPSRELVEASAACFHNNDYIEMANKVRNMDWIQQADATFDPHYTVLNWDARFWVEQQT